jgi:hypothetical protein
LPEQADQSADGEDQADIDLGPFLAGQVDCNEGAEAGLNVGDAEDEPVQPAQAFPRRREPRFRWWR